MYVGNAADKSARRAYNAVIAVVMRLCFPATIIKSLLRLPILLPLSP